MKLSLILAALLAVGCWAMPADVTAADYTFKMVSVEGVDKQLPPGMEAKVPTGSPTAIFELKNTSKRPMKVMGIGKAGPEPTTAALVSYQARTAPKAVWKSAGLLSTGATEPGPMTIAPGETRLLKVGVFNLATQPQPGGEGRVGLREDAQGAKMYWSDPVALVDLRKPE